MGSLAGPTDLSVKPDATGILPFKLNAGRNIILGQPKRFKLDVSVDVTGGYTCVYYMSNITCLCSQHQSLSLTHMVQVHNPNLM